MRRLGAWVKHISYGGTVIGECRLGQPVQAPLQAVIRRVHSSRRFQPPAAGFRAPHRPRMMNANSQRHSCWGPARWVLVSQAKSADSSRGLDSSGDLASLETERLSTQLHNGDHPHFDRSFARLRVHVHFVVFYSSVVRCLGTSIVQTQGTHHPSQVC